MYVSIRVCDEEPIFSKRDTEEKLDHDVLKARTLIPSQFSMPIHRKGSKYEKEQTFRCLYRAKARCHTHSKASMSHRGQTPEVLHVATARCLYIDTRAKYDTDQNLERIEQMLLLPPSFVRASNCRPRTNARTRIRPPKDEYERLNANTSAGPHSPTSQPISQPTNQRTSLRARRSLETIAVHQKRCIGTMTMTMHRDGLGGGSLHGKWFYSQNQGPTSLTTKHSREKKRKE